MVYIAPSLLAADFSALGREVAKIEQADMLHIDIMDGHFVPNISFGPAVVAALRDKTKLLFDVHLMLERPSAYIPAFRKAGADVISFHVECKEDPQDLIGAIRASGAQAGCAINPETPVSAIGDWGRRLRQVTVMTVNPGFGGQTMKVEALRKVFQLKSRFPGLLVEVDGGVNLETAPLCKAAGVDILVAGTSVFQAADPSLEMRCLAI